MTFTIDVFREQIPSGSELRGDPSLPFDGFRPVLEAERSHVSWLKPGARDARATLNASRAGCIVCDGPTYALYEGPLEGRLFVVTPAPRSTYARFLRRYLDWKRETRSGAAPRPAIHPTAIVDPACVLGKDVAIGAYSVVGACTIGDGTVVHEYVRIADDVEIGRECVIREFCSIGGQGFGIVQDENGDNFHMPHVGKVVIRDHVLVFPFTNVDRATLGETVIGDHTCIDHFCHIGHNSRTGRNAIITAGVTLCGGSQVGDGTWLGVHSAVKEKARVGSRVTTGIGAVVTSDVPDGQTWVGNPATEMSAFLRQRKFVKDNS